MSEPVPAPVVEPGTVPPGPDASNAEAIGVACAQAAAVAARRTQAAMKAAGHQAGDTPSE